MKLYDISQEVFGCAVYPGDPAPQRFEDLRMAQGSLYNLTSFAMCAHNGTHVDAPFHFLADGDTVGEGSYFLCAAPLALAGSDGAPCRAILIQA